MLLILPLFSFAGPIEGGGGPGALSVFKDTGLKREIPLRQLNLVLRNHNYTADVERHPSSRLKLFDSCVRDNRIESISKAPRTHCVDWVEENVLVNGVEQSKLTCRYWSKMRLKNALRYAKKNPKECKIVFGMDHPNQSLYGSRPNEEVPLCNYNKELDDFKQTQRVEVYTMNDFASDKIYIRDIDKDRANPGYIRYNYTLPKCQ